jgi:hypothetical protein
VIVQLFVSSNVLSNLREKNQIVEPLNHLAIEVGAENLGGFIAAHCTPLLRLGKP